MAIGPFVAQCLIPHLGRLRTLQLGLLVMTLGISLFGFAKLIPQDWAFISLSMLSRTLEGFGYALSSQSTSIMALTYHESSASYLVALQLGFGLADMSGPLWGGLLYDSLGYSGIFWLEAGLTALCCLITLLFINHEAKHPVTRSSENPS